MIEPVIRRAASLDASRVAVRHGSTGGANYIDHLK